MPWEAVLVLDHCGRVSRELRVGLTTRGGVLYGVSLVRTTLTGRDPLRVKSKLLGGLAMAGLILL